MRKKRGLSVVPRRIVLVGGILMLLGACCFSYFYFNNIYFALYPKKSTFAKLEKIRSKKKEKVIKYLNHQRIVGSQIPENKYVIKCFKELLSLYKQKAYLGTKYNQIERELEEFFVVELDKFYDLLFVSNDGNIFFTIKKEDDFLANIYESRFDNIELYKKIREKTAKNIEHDVTFVDYDYYPISGEPASFFIAPITEDNQTLGYIILQLAINRINYILTDRTSLGRTGEVYLVNEKQLMITQSRFIDDITILNKVIDTEAVRNALKEKKGSKIIDDYRGKRVFSSYEQFDYEGTRWIIIAEIDEDEVVTEFYLAWEDKLFEKSLEYLEQYSFSVSQQTLPEHLMDKKKKVKVDVKEAMKSKSQEVLYTRGVATCTAFTISYPGKFGYLAHISPTDEVYDDIDWTTKIFLQGKQTNFVDTLMMNINRFDIIQHEKSYLRFGVFSTKSWSLKNILHKLIENEVDISQIKILYKNEYNLVNVIFDYNKDQI